MSKSGIITAQSMIEGHHRFMVRNTGDTDDPETDLYCVNEQGVLANNRHFIAHSMMEYQPNGDGTTDGQSLEILGYAYAYIATGNADYLAEAVKYFDAYVDYFYAGQPIPTTPQRWIANWIVNSKEPVLANYPIDVDYPTHSGFKGVVLTYLNGNTVIPPGTPTWGEYLDKATFAFDGVLAWDAINASVQAENPDGSTDWSNAGDQYDVDYIINWEGKKIDAGGNVISSGHSSGEYGTIQLKDTNINGAYKTNYTTKQPVVDGGYLIDRNEVQHNRPCHVPLPGDVNQMGNAADGEEWFLDACYILWKITGETRYKQAFDCVSFTLHEYTLIDSADQFFRKSEAADTPYTDGISYSFTFPSSGVEVEYTRDVDGYINIELDATAQESMEQQSVWFRVLPESELVTEFGGMGAVTSAPVTCTVQLLVSTDKQEINGTLYGTSFPNSTSMTPVKHNVPMSGLVRLEKPGGGTYILADARAVDEYGGAVLTVDVETLVYDGRNGRVVSCLFPDDDAGLDVGFWLETSGTAPVTSIVVRTDGEFDIRITDDDGWRWYWIIPDTEGAWVNFVLDPGAMILSGYQPDHPSDQAPPTPVFTELAELVVLLENGSDTNKTFSYYCINDIPPLYNMADGYTLKYRITLACSEAYTAKVGDCTIDGYRDDSLAYTPGVIPFSNIYTTGAMQFGGWRGMPYPGYQYPMIYIPGLFDGNGNLVPSEDLRLRNMIDFVYDAQQWYYGEFGQLGPVASAYIWDRWDNYKYGPPNTWTMYHWGDGVAWSGYQPRAFQGACRAWHELTMMGFDANDYPRLVEYCENWIIWLAGFVDTYGITPTDFPPDSVPVGVPNDFTGHMAGLFLSGCCMAYMAGCTLPVLPRLIEQIVNEIQDNYPVNSGGWSSWVGGGMFFGFWSGELLRGLACYAMYHRYHVGENIYA